MDPSNISVTPGSGGSSSDGNGGNSVPTSSRRRCLMSSLPTGTQLATADGRGFGLSSPSPSSVTVSPDLESHSLHPEETPLNQVRRLLLVTPTRSPARRMTTCSSWMVCLLTTDPARSPAPGAPSPSLTTMGPATGALSPSETSSWSLPALRVPSAPGAVVEAAAGATAPVVR